MEAGKLRHIIRIQQANYATSESGQTQTTYSDFATGVFAEIKTISGHEQMKAGKLDAQVTHMVTIRWRDGVFENMRILWGIRELNIVYISEDDTHKREMYLYCKESK